MDKVTNAYLASLILGNLEVMGNMAVVPLMSPSDGAVDYLTFSEAFKKQLIEITELDVSGSIPQLKVKNLAELPVLLLDGEELIGAKQNRVLNTTVLLKEKSETIIPVSCTERGRWSYRSSHFAPGESCMSPVMRMRKHRSVNSNLEEGQRYKADQGMVWDGIADMASRSGVYSPTEAMKDVVDARAGDLKKYVESMPCQVDQKGLLVFVSGEVVGMDILSSARAYASVHSKLVSSYAIDALYSRATGTIPPLVKAAAFIEGARVCPAKALDSIGYGVDNRCQEPSMVGSSLVYRDEVIHASFFASEGVPDNTMTGFRRRRRFNM
jgi:hypothetical protein